MTFTEALHVVPNDSAAGQVKIAWGLKRDEILVNEDPISIGPAVFSGDLSDWMKRRQEYLANLYLDWPDFSFADYSTNGLLANANRLVQPGQKIVWAGAGLPDQLTIAWVVVLSSLQSSEECGLPLVQFERLQPRQYVIGMGELSVDKIRDFCPEPLALGDIGTTEYAKAWNIYTSDDPTELAEYLQSPVRQPILQRAMQSLVLRYPDMKTGISYCDELILKYANEKGPNAAKVVAYTMGFYECMDSLGDAYVFDRIHRLADESLETPLLKITFHRAEWHQRLDWGCSSHWKPLGCVPKWPGAEGCPLIASWGGRFFFAGIYLYPQREPAGV